jgi:uncharacterized protein YggE
MNQVLTISPDTKQITANADMKMIAFHIVTTPEAAERAVRENQRRATEIGPVLEAILQNPWCHWGPDDL